MDVDGASVNEVKACDRGVSWAKIDGVELSGMKVSGLDVCDSIAIFIIEMASSVKSNRMHVSGTRLCARGRIADGLIGSVSNIVKKHVDMEGRRGRITCGCLPRAPGKQ